ncbi:hypothetical protein NP493_791g00003 [Ridgeia piscesae]|uniref:Protein phosphatase 1 regulatory subunit 42 n=1 Tax=Ridgeia piscesae TaxID=27915 RepID=A0AAD9KNK9_RIDPI|nr:hypothetical protein NP493_791g00003 [Ridgeia piscesae]
MVKLTMDLIARGTSGYTKKKRDESMQHYLKRLTHLYLEDRNIDEIGDDLSLCRNLVVLYLYDNKLEKMPNLRNNCNVTHLYLQNNNINKLENLGTLRRLTKLYVGNNSIAVLEGLEKIDCLQELHIEHQKLPLGEKLLFDPRSIKHLAPTLEVLNVSGNHLDSIIELCGMTKLTQFMASDNSLTDMREVTHCLGAWQRLSRLDLIGNPLCHKAKYRDRIIIIASSLGVLDGKEVTATAKQFLKNWQANKEAVKKKRLQTMSGSETMSFGDIGERDLPPLSAPIKHPSFTGFLMPALPKRQMRDVLVRSMSQPHPGQTMIQRGPHGTFSEMSGPKLPMVFGNQFMSSMHSEPHASLDIDYWP